MSTRSSFIVEYERSRPSRVYPAFSATRWEAELRGSTSIEIRPRPSSESPQRDRRRTARGATPRPRALAPTR